MFDLLSPFYDFLIPCMSRLRLNKSYIERIQREFLAQLDFKQGHRLLDVGIGTGISLVCLQPRPQSVVGVDPSIGMLRRCARRLLRLGIQGELFCHSAEELCFADHEFDRITCLNALMYAPSYPRVIKEMLRVLKPSGKLVIMVGSDWLSRLEKPLFQEMDREILVTKLPQGLITTLAIQPRKSEVDSRVWTAKEVD
jgi:ubiquinone/menaquinone biosynthesis C-methylase UbiE